MDEQITLGLCIDVSGEQATICELTEVGKKDMEDGGSEEMWKEWSEWFPLEELLGRICRKVTAKTNTM